MKKSKTFLKICSTFLSGLMVVSNCVNVEVCAADLDLATSSSVESKNKTSKFKKLMLAIAATSSGLSVGGLIASLLYKSNHPPVQMIPNPPEIKGPCLPPTSAPKNEEPKSPVYIPKPIPPLPSTQIPATPVTVVGSSESLSPDSAIPTDRAGLVRAAKDILTRRDFYDPSRIGPVVLEPEEFRIVAMAFENYDDPTDPRLRGALVWFRGTWWGDTVRHGTPCTADMCLKEYAESLFNLGAISARQSYDGNGAANGQKFGGAGFYFSSCIDDVFIYALGGKCSAIFCGICFNCVGENGKPKNDYEYFDNCYRCAKCDDDRCNKDMIICKSYIKYDRSKRSEVESALKTMLVDGNTPFGRLDSELKSAEEWCEKCFGFDPNKKHLPGGFRGQNASYNRTTYRNYMYEWNIA